MNITKILIAGLIGGVVAFILGYLAWGLLLGDFFEANSGSASGVMRADEEMLWIPMILGHLSWGLFFALIFGRWANISTFVTGAKAGAVLGFLVSFTFDMINLGSTNLSTLTGAIVDILVMSIIAAIVGGVVGWYLGRGK
jgi:uncharacterized membrane protein